MTDTTKKCSKCGEVKLIGEFKKAKRAKSGFASLCKPCASLESKEYRIRNPAKQAERRNERRDFVNASRRKTRNKRLFHYRAKEAEYQRTRGVFDRSFFADRYLKELIVQGTELSRVDIPQSLINLKREQLKLTRLIKEKQK